MWLYFNDGVSSLTIGLLTTYLRTIYKLLDAEDRLIREELVSYKQKPDTLTKHLNMAENVGLLWKRPERYCIGKNNWKSYPNLYIIRNPSYKVWVNTIDDITDCFSYQILKALGKALSDYYQKKFEPMIQNQVVIESLTLEDYMDNMFRFDISAFGITAVYHTKPIHDYVYNKY